MENTGYIALSRQQALWRRMDAIANNLANMNTTGYRGQDALFTDYLVRSPNDDSAFREQINFVQDFGTIQDLSAGPLKDTSNPMDLALDGKGFFVIETADGMKYTRAGNFVLDNDGQLVTRDGDPVMTENDTPIFIAPNESLFEVSADGTVSTENGPIGTLKIVQFDNEQDLRRTASTLYEPAPGVEPKEAEGTRVVQGMLEGSNVNGVVEMTKMIDVQRAYERTVNLMTNEHERTLKAMQTWAKRI